MTDYNIPSFIDHTLLKPTATAKDIDQLCKEAIEYQMASVCVNGYWVKRATENVKNSGVDVAAVVGFPLGAMDTEIKALEAKRAVKDGASEIDMVANVGLLLEGDFDAYRDDILQVKQAIGDKVLKVILETGYLSEEQICQACKLAVEAGADFVKTSTGFGPRGASLEDIEIMKRCTPEGFQIKASGGIRDLETTLKFIEAGATRIGASAGVRICKAWEK